MKKSVIIFAVSIITNCFVALAQKQEKILFPPIDKKNWLNTPCVNGRLATREETNNGTALLFYDPKESLDAKAYNMKLPKLAYIKHRDTKKDELVVVIQIVQTAKDTMVGYRPLSGGNGASIFRDFRFLTEKEIKKLTN